RLGLLRELRGRRAQVRRQQPLEGLTGRRRSVMPPPVKRTLDSVFRPFEGSSAERSDRSAGDRARHRLKVRESIRENIADIIAEESIIGKDREKIIKVPIRGIRERVKRKFASRHAHAALLDTPAETALAASPERFPFHEDDLVYRHMVTDVKRESNAVVMCIMDTSGSMDTMKKYLARSFFFLL